MSSDFDQPWWQPTSIPFSPPARLSQSEGQKIGITGHQIDIQVQGWVKQHVHLDAYKAFAIMSNQNLPPTYDIPFVDRVDDTPGNDVDVFSDGALNQPTCPFFAVSNSAVWWPGRRDEPEATEYTHTVHKIADDGLETYTSLMGASTSSARPELLAVILAMLAPRAIHLGVDNLSVVQNANKLLNRMLNPQPLPVPNFCIMKDGDLWKIFW
eukprot:12404411-Karenia_brevis.AAC.1